MGASALSHTHTRTAWSTVECAHVSAAAAADIVCECECDFTVIDSQITHLCVSPRHSTVVAVGTGTIAVRCSGRMPFGVQCAVLAVVCSVAPLLRGSLLVCCSIYCTPTIEGSRQPTEPTDPPREMWLLLCGDRSIGIWRRYQTEVC